MKILFVDQFSEPGGAQIALQDLLDEVVRRGWKAEVLVPGNGQLHAACAARGIQAWPLPSGDYSNGRKSAQDVVRYGGDSVRSWLAIRSRAKRWAADLIYANGPRVLPAAVLAARSLDLPVVFHLHSYLDREYTRRIVRWCIGQRRVKVLAISRFVAEPFDRSAGAGKINVIYNGVADHGFVARPRKKPACIGILGRISSEKGQLDFVRAAKSMARAYPEMQFAVFGSPLFSGDTYEREVRAVAEGAPVEFRGWTRNVSAALHEMDILAVPSGAGEGATRVIMEAFSAGTPVVAYPSGGIPELVRHGEAALVTRSRSHEALAGALGELLNDPTLARRLSIQGRIEWEARFRLDRWQREVCGFIAELLAPAAAPSALPATSVNRSARPAPESGDDGARVLP